MTQFLPIIHNLHKDDAGFHEAQAYNAAIAQKKEFLQGCNSLHQKIEAIKQWQDLCNAKLQDFKNAVNEGV
jgi:hypothetical protein